MDSVIFFVVAAVIWFVLMKYVLPRFGLGT